ncbi:Holliday junction resolvase RecU [Alkalihalobacillus sp. FSL R5-0424]
MRKPYGKTGMAFEDLINYTNAQYKNSQMALINKRPTPVKVMSAKGNRVLSGYFESKSTVDYDGIYKGNAIVFEAKSIEINRFELKNLHAHQLQYLIDAKKNGAVSFLLIEFRHLKLIYYVSVEFVSFYVRQAANGGRKSIPLVDFEVHGFEVKPGRKVALDYLAAVDRVKELVK